MRIVVDSHTHTISSGHAYSTIQEIAREAAGRGIEMVAITDHGPSM
ncbi:MAG: PHP domain-containing protein, partial [Oscillospiraceae bacterium]|nr:PHP domain-containing protein [Oscillospiraceae bacterium]